MLRLFSLAAFSAAAAAAPMACGGSDSSGPGAGPTQDGSIGADGGPGQTGDAAPPPSSQDGQTTQDAPTVNDAPFDAADGCPRTPAGADRPRHVVISHPFGTDGGKATLFEVLDLAQNGTLTRPATPVTFTMGVALNEAILFTPDGQTGIVSQDDGSIGVFNLSAAGVPTVVHAAFKGSFYAGGLALSPDGALLYVMDSNVKVNGGGVYKIPVHCDGTLGPATLLVAGSGATEMALLPNDPTKGIVAATSMSDSVKFQDAHLLDLAKGTRIASAAAFGDGQAFVSAIVIAPDGKFALLADNNSIAGGSRIAALQITPTLAPAAGGPMLTPFPDGLAMSPYGNAGIVLNDDTTDQIHILSYTPSDAGKPFAITGELAYNFGKPQIPVTISMISRGGLKGTTFVGENVAVRQLTFGSGGDVTDTAKLAMPDGGGETIVGVVGVQP